MNEALRAALERAPGVLFVCSGNMIRSAFAELYARHLGCALPVASAATTYRNDSIYPLTRSALVERGVGRSLIDPFRPTHLDDLRPAESTLAFAMTAEHLDDLRGRPRLAGTSFLLRELEGVEAEIADPLFDGGYDEAFAAIARCVERLVEEQE